VASDPAGRFQSGEQMAAALLAHAPREAGKLALAEFVRSLFDTDTRSEAAERETLVAGATSLPAAPPQVAGPGHTASTGDGARDPLLGTVLTDRYFVRRLVGEGAMGRVYEGHHTGIGKRVAIKIPRHGERRKNELLQRFRLEAQAASQIRHPNIADVTDCGSTPDGRFFFVMEYIDGIDIAQLLSREGALPIERALLIAVQVCRALEAAHKAGIIHRDLKPSNVMLLRDRDQEVGDLVKVLDFGVAKFLRSEVGRPDLTRVDAAVGTPKYMAPEQIERGQDIDFRVDTYGVGGLLYFMLSGGHAPVEGDTVEDIWRRKVSDEALAISHWRSDLPPAVESLVMRSLARDPAGRPESMEILRRDLMGAIEAIRAVGSNVLPRMASSTSIINDRRVQDRRRGRKTLIALGAGGAALGLLAFTLDRARVHEPAPPQTAALRLTASAAPAASNIALARDPQGSPASATIRPAPLGAAAGIAPAAAKALVAAAQASSPAVGGQAAKAPDVKAPASPPPGSPPAARVAAAPTPATPGAPAAARGVTPAPTDALRVAPGSGVATKRLASAGPMVSSRRRAGATPASSPVPHVGTAEKPGVRTMPSAGGTTLEAKQLLDQAEQLFQEAQFPSAAYTARQALSAGAGAPAEVLLGHIYRTIGEFNDAKLAYQRALKIAPKDRAATEGLRKAQAALGESSPGKVAGKEVER
jgi:tRNA A-37 threonylcarbamoyl transferase component Bud32/tetratricopeptide (TPR) repeat protein